MAFGHSEVWPDRARVATCSPIAASRLLRAAGCDLIPSAAPRHSSGGGSRSRDAAGHDRFDQVAAAGVEVGPDRAKFTGREKTGDRNTFQSDDLAARPPGPVRRPRTRRTDRPPLRHRRSRPQFMTLPCPWGCDLSGRQIAGQDRKHTPGDGLAAWPSACCAWTARPTSRPPTATTPATRSARCGCFRPHERLCRVPGFTLAWVDAFDRAAPPRRGLTDDARRPGHGGSDLRHRCDQPSSSDRPMISFIISLAPP